MKCIQLTAFILLFSQLGCSSFNHKLKELLGGDTKPVGPPPSDVVRYSENSELAPRVRRQYKRTTRESLANDAGLDQKTGSLWVMEGQGAYLFAQNVMRLVGDPIGVNIEGEPKEQLQAKTDVIRDLLAKIEDRLKARQRALASENGEAKPAEEKEKKSDDKDKKTADAGKTEKSDFNVKMVPTRVVERTVDGNYRVKGSQPFMIGQREYKVIVTGIVRAEEFSDDGISATKLLEPKFDIVSTKRATEI
jgi:flagellar L-ring protein precursor FlgH